jgi:hypothetical protein
MSTEHQKYSTENQGEIIRRYAEQRGLALVRTYEDSGKSGLRIDGRDALKRLIDDVRSGVADFSAILVDDVSRWGRFQDADESAYYEFICKEAGITVHYCAEQQRRRSLLSRSRLSACSPSIGLARPLLRSSKRRSSVWRTEATSSKYPARASSTISSGARPLLVARSFSFLAVSAETCTSMVILYGFRESTASAADPFSRNELF